MPTGSTFQSLIQHEFEINFHSVFLKKIELKLFIDKKVKKRREFKMLTFDLRVVCLKVEFGE